MLSSGEIANLFARDEMDEILQELAAPMKREFPRRPITNESLNDYYLSRVVKNLHIVLCFSPVGQKFRNRSLKFPGLISGCTMDWFQRWPKDALIAVSNHFLSKFDIVCTPKVKEAVVNTMGVFQVSFWPHVLPVLKVYLPGFLLLFLLSSFFFVIGSGSRIVHRIFPAFPPSDSRDT